MQQQAPHRKETTKLPSHARATFDVGRHAIRNELHVEPILFPN